MSRTRSSTAPTTNHAKSRIHTCELKWTIIHDALQYDVLTSSDFSTRDSPIRWRVKCNFMDGDSYSQNEPDTYRIWYAKLEAFVDEGPDTVDYSDFAVAGETSLRVRHSNNRTDHFRSTFVAKKSEIRIDYMEVCVYGSFTGCSMSDMTLTCGVNFFNVNEAIPSIVSGQSSSFSDAEGFENMYLSKKHSDLTISIDGHPYAAHKVILAGRSKVFEAMFEHNMLENNENLLVIEDIEERVFLEMLRFIYTGKVQNANELVYDLLPVADRYDIRGLKIFCENVLRRQLSARTVWKILLLADTCNAENLKRLATEFVLRRSKEAADHVNPHWRELVSRPTLSKCLMISLLKR